MHRFNLIRIVFDTKNVSRHLLPKIANTSTLIYEQMIRCLDKARNRGGEVGAGAGEGDFGAVFWPKSAPV